MKTYSSGVKRTDFIAMKSSQKLGCHQKDNIPHEVVPPVDNEHFQNKFKDHPQILSLGQWNERSFWNKLCKLYPLNTSER